jgi:hypothetical protein
LPTSDLVFARQEDAQADLKTSAVSEIIDDLLKSAGTAFGQVAAQRAASKVSQIAAPHSAATSA